MRAHVCAARLADSLDDHLHRLPERWHVRHATRPELLLIHARQPQRAGPNPPRRAASAISTSLARLRAPWLAEGAAGMSSSTTADSGSPCPATVLARTRHGYGLAREAVPAVSAQALSEPRPDGHVTERLAQSPSVPFGLTYPLHPSNLPEVAISVFWHAKVLRSPAHQGPRTVVFDLFGGGGAVKAASRKQFERQQEARVRLAAFHAWAARNGRGVLRAATGRLALPACQRMLRDLAPRVKRLPG